MFIYIELKLTTERKKNKKIDHINLKGVILIENGDQGEGGGGKKPPLMSIPVTVVIQDTSRLIVAHYPVLFSVCNMYFVGSEST